MSALERTQELCLVISSMDQFSFRCSHRGRFCIQIWEQDCHLPGFTGTGEAALALRVPPHSLLCCLWLHLWGKDCPDQECGTATGYGWDESVLFLTVDREWIPHCCARVHTHSKWGDHTPCYKGWAEDGKTGENLYISHPWIFKNAQEMMNSRLIRGINRRPR